ncbi:MAG: hypothetical protein Salg2KO_09080 [Salibacteraceae bacterium]
MKSDIEFPEVNEVGVCAIPKVELDQTYWHVHLINMRDSAITNVLVSTRGYGKREEEQVKTSELRHYFEQIDGKSTQAIEVIPSDLVGLSNQYWVSFYIDRKIFDKKFVFLPDTLLDKNLTKVPVLDQDGILII